MIRRYLCIFRQLKFMGTKITYFYPQVEVRYGLLSHEIPVYADFTIFIVE